MDNLINQFKEACQTETFVSGIFSSPKQKSNDLKKVKIKPVMIKNQYHLQLEYHYMRIIKHDNILPTQLVKYLPSLIEQFKQLQCQTTTHQWHVQISKKNKILFKSKASAHQPAQLSHNRQKQYLLQEGHIYPFLVELGVQTNDGKIKQAKYDKFKQINRFLEFVADSLHYLPKDRPLKIIDFGSGKSYLTFALYHFLSIEQKLNVHIIGLDLKKEVIEYCQTLAKKLNYTQLNFQVGDINDYQDVQQIDMVITLHACDVATDMALSKAVNWQAKVILSVPCCHHELNQQIASDILSPMLNYGLIQERFAALATDTMRAELLSFVGYETQIVEFIDSTYTPKNLMIRAFYTQYQPSLQRIQAYQQLRDSLQAQPYLEKQLVEYLKQYDI